MTGVAGWGATVVAAGGVTVVGIDVLGAVGTTVGGVTCVGTALGVVCATASCANKGVDDKAMTAAIAVMPGRMVSLLIIGPINAAVAQ